MSHYYDANQDHVKSAPRRITFDHAAQTYTLITDHGVFSHGHIDEATELLIDTVHLEANQSMLDLGCGYGVIGIVLAKRDGVHVTLSDVNTRALALAKENAHLNQVTLRIVESEGFEHIQEQYDAILTNPPIRIGKQALYALYAEAIEHLKPGGSLYLVLHKKHGALSTLAHLSTKNKATLLCRHKGFHVIRCDKD